MLDSWFGEAVSLVAGAALNLAFAPYRLGLLAPLAAAVLYMAWRRAGARSAALRGALFGVGLFGVGVPWVATTLARFGGMPAPLAFAGDALFVAILASYIALVGALFAAVRRGNGWDPWLFASLWVGGEWLRNHLFTGFPWFDLGYAAAWPPVVQWAPILGVLGLSFAFALIGALTVEALGGRWRGLWPLALGLALTPLVGRAAFVHPTGRVVTASLIQGDVSPYTKWSPRERQAIIRRYLRLTARSDGRLVIWPETAVPGYSHTLRRHFLPVIERLARRDHRHFLFGLVEGNPNRPRAPVYNAVMSVGRHDGMYRKRHLVPFGEYLPCPRLLSPVLAVLHIPMSGFTAWHGREPALPVRGARLGLTICYEVAYGRLVTQALPRATLLVNVSDDSWYGHSEEAHQQLQIAQMRAAEAGRDMLVATNDGETARITHTGRIAQRLAPFTPGVLTVAARAYRGLTPYDRWADRPILGLSAAIVLLVLIDSRRARRQSAP